MIQARRMHKIKNAYKILAGKPEGTRPLLKSRRRQRDNKIDIIKQDVGWIYQALLTW